MKRVLLSLLLIGAMAVEVAAQRAADYVKPIIGATTHDEFKGSIHGLGKTFPGVCTPFGLVQLSPDTKTGGDNGSGYSWHHKTIEGFSFTHMSGVGWYGDLGNFLVMPTTGELKVFKGLEERPDEGYRSRFSHEREQAQVHKYTVILDDYDIKAELAAAPRSGIIRFTYPKSDVSRIQIDLARRIGGSSDEQYVEVVDDNTIRGWMRCTPRNGGFGDGQGQVNYTVYFYCCFDRPLKQFGVWSADIPDGVARRNWSNDDPAYHEYIKRAEVHAQQRVAQGEHLGFYTEFPTAEGEQAMLKCGISFVSMEGAQRNLMSDIPDWDFDGVSKRAYKLWNKALSGVEVEGDERDKTIFYTSLYHTMIDPRCFSDVDGAYRGADGEVYSTDGFVYRTIFSGWDVFRSQFPLQTIINPSLVNDEINSLIQLAQKSGRGYYPRWELLNAYTGCMLGNPAVSVLADAYQKGIRNYDVAQAVEYAVNSVRKFSNNDDGYRPGSLSETLEYAYADWCVSELLRATGDNERAEEFARRGQSYRSVWCDEVKWFRTRLEDGSWLEWRGREVHNQGCMESNNYQQGWFVPHDIEGLIELMGQDYYDSELIRFFEGADEKFMWGDYYNHPNEPNHQVPFMLNYTSKPWLTQYWTRKICADAYNDTVTGLCGNEDVGQMSAWYILASIGFHPICPGSTRYELTSPQFDRVTIQLDREYYKGRKFTIIARNNSPENVYIQSVKLNGKLLDRLWITHEEITRGGVLEFTLGDKPKQ